MLITRLNWPSALSRIAQLPHQVLQIVVGLRPSGQQVPQLVVGQIEQSIERDEVRLRQVVADRIEPARQDDVVFEHPPPAAPAQSRPASLIHAPPTRQTARRTMISLILPMAFV